MITVPCCIEGSRYDTRLRLVCHYITGNNPGNNNFCNVKGPVAIIVYIINLLLFYARYHAILSMLRISYIAELYVSVPYYTQHHIIIANKSCEDNKQIFPQRDY